MNEDTLQLELGLGFCYISQSQRTVEELLGPLHTRARSHDHKIVRAQRPS